MQRRSQPLVDYNEEQSDYNEREDEYDEDDEEYEEQHLQQDQVTP
tara:strand:+ start:392 stop:526 length:135 start_codon:yes stop_codon:yes gene_type:complete